MKAMKIILGKSTGKIKIEHRFKTRSALDTQSIQIFSAEKPLLHLGLKLPVRVHLFVIRLADLVANPVANQENAHSINDWSCQICHQPCSAPRSTELVSNPTPPGNATREWHRSFCG
jgi:hypothetical protein